MSDHRIDDMQRDELTAVNENRARNRIIAIMIIVAVLGAAAYFLYPKFMGKKDDQAAQKQMPPAPVSVVEVHPSDLPLTYEYAGRTAGSRETEIRARVSGILLERTYLEGSTVKEGDILFKIDPESFNASLAEVRARAVETERNWKRINELYKAQAVSGSDRDAALSAYEQAKAALQTAQISKDWTTVRAPISGVTSREGLSEGSLVTANTSLLTRISQLDPMYVNFAYPDSDILNQRSGVEAGGISMPEGGKLSADLQFGDGTTYGTPASIDFTDTIIDPATGTIRARAVVPNPEGKIIPGQFVRVIVKGIVKKNAIAVPPQAVLQGPQGQFVYVVTQDNKAAIKPVVVGMLNGTQQIIESGLAEGDRVITEGMIKVRPDAPVNIAAPKPDEQTAPAGRAPQNADAEKKDQPAAHDENTK